MEWYIFALLSYALISVSVVIDKFVISKYIRNQFSYPVFLGIIYFLFSIIICIFVPISFNFPYNIFAILAGMLESTFLLFYAKSMMKNEASRVAIFYSLAPIFIVLLSVTFLKESLVLTKYIGILFLVISAILISYRKSERKLSGMEIFKFLLPLPILLAFINITEKYAITYIDYWSLYFWLSIGMFTFALGLLSFKSTRKSFFITIKKSKVISFILISELFTVSSFILFFIALSSGLVSLVAAFGGLQPFFILVYTTILSIFLPRILKEEITKQTIILKLIAVILVFVGTYLIVV